mgnify:CR=1 FL=1
MSSRCATKHGQIRLRKSRKSEACLGKSQTTEEPTVKWCAVEVCGFGVPLPRSNLLAARVSKSCCNRPNVGCLDLLCKRFMNIFKRAVTIPSTEHDFLWPHSAARPRKAKPPAVKQVGTAGDGHRQERYHLTLWPTNAGRRRPTCTSTIPAPLTGKGIHQIRGRYWGAAACAGGRLSNHRAMSEDCASLTWGWRGITVRPHTPTLPSRILRAR